MITLHIQLLNKVEMPFEQAKGFIACDFPKASSTLTTTGNREQGIVQVILDQDALTDKQRDWLHLSTFSACYIDGYTVKSSEYHSYRSWLPLTLVFDVLDERVAVDFFGDGVELFGEIDAIDFEGNPEYPYRVWYDTPRVEPTWGNNPPIEIECEWVRPSMLRRVEEERS